MHTRTPADPATLRAHAETIWRAGVAAVDSPSLVRRAVSADAAGLEVCGERFPLTTSSHIVVVGAGKAGAGMAAGFEDALRGTRWMERVTGWINVPEDCVPHAGANSPGASRIHLHPARPAGVNEPTEAGVEGSTRILELVAGLAERDLCLVLLSGGGSALLPAPADGLTLADKQAVTRRLMAAGATISELNCVRKQLSRIKGGRLARAAGAAPVVSLIVSDVIGDPVDVIASGPTVDDPSTPRQALDVLARFGDDGSWPPAVLAYLRARVDRDVTAHVPPGRVRNHVIGSNAVALQAAASAAMRLGYEVRSLGSANAGEAASAGRELAALCLAARDDASRTTPLCVLSGGEPVVRLAKTDAPRRGGRNQELALAALEASWGAGLDGIVILSGGTDGEDGPTDAAGAMADEPVRERAVDAGLTPAPFLAINDSYTFFDRVGGLLRTGPTHTNVMDLRVALVSPRR